MTDPWSDRATTLGTDLGSDWPVGKQPVEACRLVVLSARDELYGVEVACVRTAIQAPPVRRLSCFAPWAMGVIDLCGRVLSVIDLRAGIGGAVAGGMGLEEWVVVLEARGLSAGLVVTGRPSTVRLHGESVTPPTLEISAPGAFEAPRSFAASGFVIGAGRLRGKSVTGQLILLLDVPGLLASAEGSAERSRAAVTEQQNQGTAAVRAGNCKAGYH